MQTVALRVSGAGLPRAPLTRTRSAPISSTVDIGDVEHDVGREIGGGIVNFVEQLLDHGEAVDAPAGAGGLGDDDAAVGVDLGDRIAEIGHARHGLERRIGEIAAGDLAAAFEQMAGERAGREAIPIVRLAIRTRA